MQESSISEKIKELRTDLKMNQKNFSAAIGIRQSTLSSSYRSSLDSFICSKTQRISLRVEICTLFSDNPNNQSSET